MTQNLSISCRFGHFYEVQSDTLAAAVCPRCGTITNTVNSVTPSEGGTFEKTLALSSSDNSSDNSQLSGRLSNSDAQLNSNPNNYKARQTPVIRSLNEYVIVSELGRGGMGIVYKAWDQNIGRHVALKMVHQIDPFALKRFKSEFRALADISHPNLVSLYDLICIDNTWFFTMEFLDAVNFIEYVWLGEKAFEPKSSLPGYEIESRRLTGPILQRLQTSLSQLAEGLKTLHANEVLHCDIKPSNVMITRGGRLALVDFGLVSDIRKKSSSSKKMIQGTPDYMSPEQAAGHRLTPASDWYSIGVMLYELATGRLPFMGKPLEVMKIKQRQIPTPPKEIFATTPPWLNQLCCELLEINAEKRIITGGVLQSFFAEELPNKIKLDDTNEKVEPTSNLIVIGRQTQTDQLQKYFKEV